MAPTIAGTLSLPPIGVVDVAVSLEDITNQDGCATTIAETLLCGVEGRVPFVLDVSLTYDDPKRDYTLAARAYRQGEGQPLAGTVVVYRWRRDGDHPHVLRLQPFDPK